MDKNRVLIDSVDALENEIKVLRAAQEKFSHYTQEMVDKIFLAAASAANKARIPLAKMAVAETGMGIVEDKVIKINSHSNNTPVRDSRPHSRPLLLLTGVRISNQRDIQHFITQHLSQVSCLPRHAGYFIN